MKYIKINNADNVVVALENIASGDTIEIEGRKIYVKNDIMSGHKMSVSTIKQGEFVMKYGYPIGIAKCHINEGELVHSNNIKTALGELLEYTYTPKLNYIPHTASKTFMGFNRSNDKVGVRNEIWIVPTVGCVNSIAQIIEKQAQKLIKGSIDGIYSFSHPYGCSQLSEDHENTQKALAGLVNHPNVGGVLVLGLGCENNTIEQFKKVIGDYDVNRVKFLVCQESEDEISDALDIIENLCDVASVDKREVVDVSKLVIGLKCGGSDGFSGITANPLVGAFSDILISQGGSTILTEVPEMFGAETILMNRCESKEVFDKTVDLINDFKNYFIRYNQEIYENPSPGNKAGGISTLEDKSLGCTQKGGRATVVDVLKYGQSVCKKGLNLLQAPGNDLVAATALAVSGANIVLFTTGRGTPFGSPVPTVKISSNTALFKRKSNWIDFDAGNLLDGVDMSARAEDLFDYIISLASGNIKTKTEQNGIRDLAIFKDGVTL